ncbi:hypothetical protein D3C71_1482210 [compost metagenome]
MPAVSSRLAPRLKRVVSLPPESPRLRWNVWLLPAAMRRRGCRPGPLLRRVKIWITPPMASLPYTAEREPRSTSMRSIWSMSRNCRPLSPEVALAMRTPSTSTRLCAALVPRIKMPGRLPRPPVGATCTPGTRESRSVMLVGCRRSMSVRVKTVLAALVAVRHSTWWLALISTSGSLRASSRSAARRNVGVQRIVAQANFFMGSSKGFPQHCAVPVGAGLPAKGPGLLANFHPPFTVVAATVFAGKPAPTVSTHR